MINGLLRGGGLVIEFHVVDMNESLTQTRGDGAWLLLSPLLGIFPPHMRFSNIEEDSVVGAKRIMPFVLSSLCSRPLPTVCQAGIIRVQPDGLIATVRLNRAGFTFVSAILV